MPRVIIAPVNDSVRVTFENEDKTILQLDLTPDQAMQACQSLMSAANIARQPHIDVAPATVVQ